MPRTQEQNEGIRKATNEKILSSARTLFSERGFGAANIQDIAGHAKISAGLVYRHYASKEKLFEAVLDVIVESLQEILEMLNAMPSPRAFFLEFTRVLYENPAASRQMAEFYPLIYQSKFIPGLEQKAAEVIEANVRFMKAIAVKIQEGQHLGEIKPGDPLELTQHFFAALQGTALLRLIMEDECVIRDATLLTMGILEEKRDE